MEQTPPSHDDRARERSQLAENGAGFAFEHIDSAETQARWEQGPEGRQLTHMLADFEQEVDQYGWDQPPWLFQLRRLSDEQLTVRALASPEADVSLTEFIQRFAADVRSRGPALGLSRGQGPAYDGLLLAFEAWGMPKESGLPFDPCLPAADQPGAAEFRRLYLRTARGGELAVQRVRGQEPTQLVGRIEDPVVEAVRELTDALNEALRGGRP